MMLGNGLDCEIEKVFIHIIEALFGPSWPREFIAEQTRKQRNLWRTGIEEKQGDNNGLGASS
jgi:hypothetical protein